MSGVQIFDLTSLRPFYGVPTSFPRALEHHAYYDQVTSTHNAVMNEETGFLYLVGTKTCQGGLHVVDVHEPTKPEFAGCFDLDGYTHDAQCVIFRGADTKYVGSEICFNYNEDTLTIVDVSDKSNMVMLGRETYDNAEYTHQGWLTPDQKYLLLNDELDELSGPEPRTRTMMWDLSDLTKPKLFASHYPPDEIVSIDHNLYITEDGKAYLSDYTSGLRVLDTSSIASGVTPEIAFFDMCDYSSIVEFKGAWSVRIFFWWYSRVLHARSLLPLSLSLHTRSRTRTSQARRSSRPPLSSASSSSSSQNEQHSNRLYTIARVDHNITLDRIHVFRTV